ncbi:MULTISPECIES: DedA family protein [unclassified Salinibacterium]|uniref:DedA family protein n=1 Tax=unclassified Salinibacterium TaxID=2632331 RepID=UPI0018CF6883|nr:MULTISPECIES: VTT domain-containing protein [unclassified Salinibacterium]MBH0054530.1 VTT domain-containing protein [Salinibacterium sp. SWN139]MBH0084318.1 VTT domain-containing protein [Salinibacterium sp. SWN167]MBH0131358.1 VTT domain-containing protein [Salinibacterium sp. NK8237]
MVGTAIIPWLDPQNLITGFGAFALLGVAFIVFAETGLLVGFFLPGDTLLLITGVLTFAGVIEYDIWWVCLAVSLAAFLGGEVGYLIGHKVGPKIFERKETGLFSVENVKRTNAFFTRFGGLAVIMARFVPIVRTFAPVAAGVGHMDYRKYSLYNAIGALIWGSGLTFGGYLLGYIPWLSDFIVEYIDLILLAAVTLTVLPTAYHYFRSSYKAKKARETGRAEALDDAEAEKLALHPKDFNQDFDD